MDKLTERLRRDADCIEVKVSDELERRLEASLQSLTPLPAESNRPQQRGAWFWWASSLTGAAAALVVLAIVNQSPQTSIDPQQNMTTPPVTTAAVPILELRAESAMLTQPLKQELEDLQSDLRKAELIVKDDIGL